MEPTLKIVDIDIYAYTFDTYNISIVSFRNNFEIIYEPSQTLSIHQVGQNFKYRYLVNGSFFEWSGKHAGWLSISGNKLTPLKHDRQLTHIAILNTTTGEMVFKSAELWEPSMSDKANIEFQTGPLVIQGNVLDMPSIRQSINGQRSHQRTLLGYTEEDKMKFFINVRKPERLDKLGEYLLKLSIFEAKTLSVINLDGGPSVALYTLTHPEMNHNGGAVLPILFALRCLSEGFG
jgi:exopolysaccharide biosynthesis protein